MQLIIDLNESDFIKIMEVTIKHALRNDPYTSTGEAAEYIQSQTKIALMNHLRQLDFNGLVTEVASTLFGEIVEDAVRKEIVRITKKTVKELNPQTFSDLTK